MIQLAILFGGVSSEHAVSCVSAASILRNLDRTRFAVHALGITQQGRWFLYENANPDCVQDGTWEQQPTLLPAVLSPDRDTHGLLVQRDGTTQAVRLDCVFPVLHGIGGEDGTVQGLFELAGLPYVGAGIAASANAMDKGITKIILQAAGIPQAAYYLAHRFDFTADATATATQAAQTLGNRYPMFVKPCRAGSSVGVSRAENFADLCDGLQAAFAHDSRVLVEEFIDGAEVEVAVLGNRNPIASIAGEIAPAQTFYSYDAKYNDDTSALYIPARMPDDAMAQVRALAVRVYQALGCTGLSRVDFFYTKAGGLILNEINTLPGFTSISMYPKLWAHMGVDYTTLISRLVDLAMEDDAHAIR